MSHDIYIFGSAVRGEVTEDSDIDVLVIPFAGNPHAYPAAWSVYTQETIKSYYESGRLFAWHLHLEAKCIHSHGQVPFLNALGEPAPYMTAENDIADLFGLLCKSLDELRIGTESAIYELGIAYTAIRDIAMSASWCITDRPCFSRDAPYLLPVVCPLPREAYEVAMAARHASTRGARCVDSYDQAVSMLLSAPLHEWVGELRKRI